MQSNGKRNIIKSSNENRNQSEKSRYHSDRTELHVIKGVVESFAGIVGKKVFFVGVGVEVINKCVILLIYINFAKNLLQETTLDST